MNLQVLSLWLGASQVLKDGRGISYTIEADAQHDQKNVPNNLPAAILRLMTSQASM